MKTVEDLLNARGDRQLGNHRVEFSRDGLEDKLRFFYYYDTVICIVNDSKQVFSIDSSYGTSSTTRACNSYRREISSYYEEVGMESVR